MIFSPEELPAFIQVGFTPNAEELSRFLGVEPNQVTFIEEWLMFIRKQCKVISYPVSIVIPYEQLPEPREDSPYSILARKSLLVHAKFSVTNPLQTVAILEFVLDIHQLQYLPRFGVPSERGKQFQEEVQKFIADEMLRISSRWNEQIGLMEMRLAQIRRQLSSVSDYSESWMEPEINPIRESLVTITEEITIWSSTLIKSPLAIEYIQTGARGIHQKLDELSLAVDRLFLLGSGALP